MKLTVVSTFSEDNWNDYASRSIPSWLDNFDSSTQFHFHCDFKPLDDPRVTYISNSKDKNLFLERNYLKNRLHKSKGYHGKWDRYCHKVFAQCESAIVAQSEILLFLDADVASLKSFSINDAKTLLNGSFCGFIGRDNLVSECGFLLYDLTLDPKKIFFNRFLNYYKNDEIFNLKFWDDCFVFDTCRQLSPDYTFCNLSGRFSSFIDPIAVGPVGEFFDHWMSKSGKNRGTSKYREFRGKI